MSLTSLGNEQIAKQLSRPSATGNCFMTLRAADCASVTPESKSGRFITTKR